MQKMKKKPLDLPTGEEGFIGIGKLNPSHFYLFDVRDSKKWITGQQQKTWKKRDYGHSSQQVSSIRA